MRFLLGGENHFAADREDANGYVGIGWRPHGRAGQPTANRPT
jgi:hypothetical protein